MSTRHAKSHRNFLIIHCMRNHLKAKVVLPEAGQGKRESERVDDERVQIFLVLVYKQPRVQVISLFESLNGNRCNSIFNYLKGP